MESRSKIVKKFLAIIILFCLADFGCRSSPAGEVKLVLDQYDEINKDYVVSMKEYHKEKRLDSIQRDLGMIKDRCAKIVKIDLSRAPSDFNKAFSNLASFGCDAKSIEDMTTYEGDPKTRLFHVAERDLETLSVKYGYNYKNRTSPN